MKQLFKTFAILLFSVNIFAQAPSKMSYQCVIRNTSGALVTNQAIGMKISILKNSATGTAVYVETQTSTTNANGLATIDLGAGTAVTNTFDSVDWSNGTYYLKTEVDPTGGTSYTVISTSQFLSVPYALYAKKSGTPGPQGQQGIQGLKGDTGGTGPIGPQGVKGDTGVMGLQGPMGPQGIKGDTGVIGLQGPMGPQGIKGDTGARGLQGLNGDTAWAISGTVIYNKNSGNVGIGTASPQSKLSIGSSSQFQVDTVGNVKKINNISYSFPSLQGSSGQVLSNNGSGTLSWQNVGSGSSGWGLTGNSGTNSSVNYIGTTDTAGLTFKVYSTRAGFLDTKTFSTFYGVLAGISNTSAAYNTAIGYSSFYYNFSGTENTATGAFSLNNNGTGSGNAAFGENASYNNYQGNNNTAIGWSALKQNSAGSSNTAIGSWSLLNNASDNNTAVGAYTLYTNAGGSNATAIGYKAMLYANSSSTAFTNYNVAVGFESIRGSIYANTGNYNTAVGYQTLRVNYTGNYNVAIGTQALYSNSAGNYNTACGYQALYTATNATNNTAYGYGALYSDLSGDYNTASGYAALYYNNNGHYNSAMGCGSLTSNSSGWQNTAMGYNALTSNSTGFENTAIGNNALYSNTGGYYNTAIGSQSLYSTNLTSYSNKNTAIGYQSLYSNTTGINNTGVGAGVDASSGNDTNSTALGYNTTITASNQVRIGNSSVSSIGGQVGWTTLSDGRMKENVKEEVLGLSFINSLRPVTYTLNTKKFDNFIMQQMPDSIKSKRMQTDQAYQTSSSVLHTGFIAQEVEVAAKKVGYTFDGVDAPKNENDLYGLRYSEFVVPLVKAVQELSKQNEDQQKLILELTKRIEKLENK